MNAQPAGCRAHRSVPVPAPFRRTPLLRKGGFEVYEGLFDDLARRRLLSEALSLLQAASFTFSPASDAEEVRGGDPARRFHNASGGKVQAGYFHSPDMSDFLRHVSGLSLVPSGGLGTYSYYMRAGDHLAIHRDIVSCDVAVITCLHEGPSPTQYAGILRLYPERLEEGLSTLRADPERGAVGVRLLPGQTIVMFGGIVPHGVLPVADGQNRLVSLLCFRACV